MKVAVASVHLLIAEYVHLGSVIEQGSNCWGSSGTKEGRGWKRFGCSRARISYGEAIVVGRKGRERVGGGAQGRETHVITREVACTPLSFRAPHPSHWYAAGHGPPGEPAPLLLYNLGRPASSVSPSSRQTEFCTAPPTGNYKSPTRSQPPVHNLRPSENHLPPVLAPPLRATTMSTQTAFTSFDPLATHPFTNNSGLLPKPVAPSQFPRPIPAPLRADAATVPVPSTNAIHAPQPRKVPSPSKSSARMTSSGPRPIFVPFRPERSSPELDDILLKKKVSDVFANKNTWSIDHIEVVPAASPNTRR